MAEESRHPPPATPLSVGMESWIVRVHGSRETTSCRVRRKQFQSQDQRGGLSQILREKAGSRDSTLVKPGWQVSVLTEKAHQPQPGLLF